MEADSARADRCVMFFEVSRSGHRLDYVQKLMAGVAEKRITSATIFVLSPDFKGHLSPDPSTDAEIIYMSETDQQRCQVRSAVRRRLNTYRVFNRYLKATGADVGFVNYLDTVLPVLALPSIHSHGAKVSGILFRPTVHYPVDAATSAVHPRRARMSAKAETWIFGRVLADSRTGTILSLDPLFPDYAAARYPGGTNVRVLPEPFDPPPVETAVQPSDGRTVFLLFGTISRRKGLLETLHALESLEPEVSERARLVIAGRVQPDLKGEMEVMVKGLAQRRPEIEVDIRDGFIPDDDLVALVRSSHVVLAPYQRHVGSSGSLVWAAHFRRPVISQSFGLMGVLTQQYRLGVTCDPRDTNALAGCIRRAVMQGPESLGDPTGMAEFASANNTGLFIDAIASAVDNGTSRQGHSPRAHG